MNHIRKFSLLLSLFSAVFIFNRISQNISFFDPSLAALAQNTVGRSSSINGNKITTDYNIEELYNFYYECLNGNSTKVLIFGASQLMAINQYNVGDELMVYYANKSAISDDVKLRYYQVAAPNLNYNEMLSYYLQLRQENMLPDWLVINLTYDDLREYGLRKYATKNLQKTTLNMLSLKYSGINNILSSLDSKKFDNHAISAKPNLYPQEILETYLENNIPLLWDNFKNRDLIRAFLKSKAYFYSGLIVGKIVSPFIGETHSAPLIPEDLKKWNNEGLQTLISIALNDGIKIHLVRAPHPEYKGEFYHDRTKYDYWFSEMKITYENTNIKFIDYENIIDTKYWGLNNAGRLDVFHFQSKGHKIFGESLNNSLKQYLDMEN